MNNNTILVNYTYPEGSPASGEIDLKINDEKVFVYNTTTAYFAVVSFEGRINVEVTTTRNIENVIIRPLKHGIKPEYDDHSIRFSISEPMNLFIEINNQVMPLFLFANELEENVPSSQDSDVLHFESGKIYEVGTLELKDNQTVYIEGGAVVRGVIRATNADNVRICGRGIFDGSLEPQANQARRFFLVFEGCKNLVIEGIVLIEPPLWMLVLGACENVRVSNIKEIGHVVSSDGIDVVGSRNVEIDGAFIFNNDDCIAIKSLDLSMRPTDAKISWSNDVDNVVVKNSVLYTSEKNGGSAMEIGYELRTGYIQNVTFENIDVIAVHGYGCVFGIHNGDRAEVRNIKYENIRVEHCFDRLVDFRIQSSPMWNKDDVKGQVRDIYFKDIYIIVHPFNEGYTHSLMGGYTNEHTIEGVVFDNFFLGDKKARTIDDIWLFMRHAANIEFK